jgi:hypothetical protein
VVANESSGDLRLVETRTYPAFVLPESHASSAVGLWCSALQSIDTISATHAAASGETDSVAFWNQFFSDSRPADTTNRGPDEQPKELVAPPGTQIEYVHLGPNGLRYVQDVKSDELPNLNGDAILTVSPAQFRYGRVAGSNRFLHSAQLRFDIHQSQQFWNVLPVLAWTSLAAIFPDKSGKLPPIQQLNFSSNSDRTVLRRRQAKAL